VHPPTTRSCAPANNSARKRIFDGAPEAKLIALACLPPPRGRQRWALALLEAAAVERNIVDRASDDTIGRTLKRAQPPPPEAMAHFASLGRWAVGLPSGSVTGVFRSNHVRFMLHYIGWAMRHCLSAGLCPC
jgi:hypothetical protein